MKRCETKYCKNKPQGRLCSTCRSRISRSKNPVRYAYSNLKNNAKRRGKVFRLTLDQFAKFCVKYDYIKGKGRKSTSLSIDCKEPDKGYTPDNIQPLPLGENSRKGTKRLHYDWQTRYAVVLEDVRIESEDNPF